MSKDKMNNASGLALEKSNLKQINFKQLGGHSPKSQTEFQSLQNRLQL